MEGVDEADFEVRIGLRGAAGRVETLAELAVEVVDEADFEVRIGLREVDADEAMREATMDWASSVAIDDLTRDVVVEARRDEFA